MFLEWNHARNYVRGGKQNIILIEDVFSLEHDNFSYVTQILYFHPLYFIFDLDLLFLLNTWDFLMLIVHLLFEPTNLELCFINLNILISGLERV